MCLTDNDEWHYSQVLKRFLPDVEKECCRICEKRKLDKHIGKQIAHDTFARLRKYKKFKRNNVKLANERRAILVYLFRIATRLFNDAHKKENEEPANHDTYFDEIVAKQDEYADAEGLKRKKDIAELIFKKLNQREREVLIMDLEYKRHYKYLPDEVVENMAVKLNVKKDTIRKIRERAKEKIHTAIDAINKN